MQEDINTNLLLVSRNELLIPACSTVTNLLAIRTFPFCSLIDESNSERNVPIMLDDEGLSRV